MQCIARVARGSRTVDEPGGMEGERGREIVAATKVYDFDSLQMAPRWLDDETVSSSLCACCKGSI